MRLRGGLPYSEELVKEVSERVKLEVMEVLKKGHITMDMNEAFVRLLIDDVNNLRDEVIKMRIGDGSRALPGWQVDPKYFDEKMAAIERKIKEITEDPSKLIRTYINNFTLKGENNERSSNNN